MRLDENKYILQVLDEHTDILYQISAESGGGVVTSREFVILRHWGVKEGTYISSGCSCTHLSAPENKKLIRYKKIGIKLRSILLMLICYLKMLMHSTLEIFP